MNVDCYMKQQTCKGELMYLSPFQKNGLIVINSFTKTNYLEQSTTFHFKNIAYLFMVSSKNVKRNRSRNVLSSILF